MKVYVTLEIPENDYRDMVEVAHLKNQTFDELSTEINDDWIKVSLDAELDYLRIVEKKKQRRAKQEAAVRRQ